MVRRRGTPSPTWRSFLRNQAAGIAAIDMFVVASASFRLLYVMIILAHDRRTIVRFDVTRYPTAGWLARQVTDAYPWDTAPRYLLRDRDASYGQDFDKQVDAMGITEVDHDCSRTGLRLCFALFRTRAGNSGRSRNRVGAVVGGFEISAYFAASCQLLLTLIRN
jgi:hypothetical protein